MKMLSLLDGSCWRRAGLVVFALLLAGAAPLSAPVPPAAPAPTPAPKVDVQELIRETQKMEQKAHQITLVWWTPKEFWEVSMAQNPGVTAAQAQEFVKVFQPYIVLAVFDGKVSPFGGITYRPEPEIRADLRVLDKAGTSYAALTEDQIQPDTKNLLAMMKPVLTNALGPLGQNMNFYVFPGKDAKDQPIAEAKTPGALAVKVGDREFKWRLPLSSLLPPKACAKCQEKCSGAWSFCPWCGTALPKGS
jgi:hypothetical protein